MTVRREPGDGAVPVAELSFTAASHELDAIVEFFEQREVDVDQLVTRLQRATAIVDELDRRIRHTRTQVEELVPRLAAAAGRGELAGGADAAGPAAAETAVDDSGRVPAAGAGRRDTGPGRHADNRDAGLGENDAGSEQPLF